MTQKKIQKRLESDYDMSVDRKAVKANLEDLINDGSYNIEYATKIRLTPNQKSLLICAKTIWLMHLRFIKIHSKMI